jgi:hypothetical protein
MITVPCQTQSCKLWPSPTSTSNSTEEKLHFLTCQGIMKWSISHQGAVWSQGERQDLVLTSCKQASLTPMISLHFSPALLLLSEEDWWKSRLSSDTQLGNEVTLLQCQWRLLCRNQKGGAPLPLCKGDIMNSQPHPVVMTAFPTPRHQWKSSGDLEAHRWLSIMRRYSLFSHKRDLRESLMD